MNITSTIPESFPGAEFSLQWGEECIYGEHYLRYGHGTSSDELQVFPDIGYRAFSAMDWGDEVKYIEGPAGKVGEAILDEGQQRAIEIAKQIKARREQQDPTLESFVSLRKVGIDNNGQLFIYTPEEGARLQGDKPFAAVKEAKQLGIIDFATATQGYYGIFKFEASDIDHFVPDEILGEANAYYSVDEPRVVVSEDGEHDYQIAKFMLLKVESDLDYPLNLLDRTVRIITVEEDGTETVSVYDPDAKN